LTEQYELAKIQEVKETPSVKVLDRAKVPEKKTAPPRMLIVLLGTFLCFSGSIVWTAVASGWRAAAPSDPRKILARQAIDAVCERVPWASHKRDAIAERLG